MEYKDMTDEEYEALADEFARNPPKINTNGVGWITQWEMRHLGLQNMTVNYLMTKAKANNKTPAQIIDEIVSKEIAAAASA
jgi:hypothetical protein